MQASRWSSDTSAGSKDQTTSIEVHQRTALSRLHLTVEPGREGLGVPLLRSRRGPWRVRGNRLRHRIKSLRGRRKVDEHVGLKRWDLTFVAKEPILRFEYSRAFVVYCERGYPELFRQREDLCLTGADPLGADFDTLAARERGIQRASADAVGRLEDDHRQSRVCLHDLPRSDESRDACTDHEDVVLPSSGRLSLRTGRHGWIPSVCICNSGGSISQDRLSLNLEALTELAEIDGRARRSAATRSALVWAAREVFRSRAYSDVSTAEIVEHAGLTRNALYYHFRSKESLFRAVYEDVEGDVARRILPRAAEAASILDGLRTGVQLFLDACLEPDVAEISVRQAPAVLGFGTMREIDNRNYLGALTEALATGIANGELRDLPAHTVASMLLGALDEAALLIASSKHPRTARADAGKVIEALLDGLAAVARPPHP